MNQREKYELVNRIIHRPTKYIKYLIIPIFFTLCVFGGFFGGAYAFFAFTPPPETKIVNGYVHRPCGLSALPGIFLGGGAGMLVGGFVGFRGTRRLYSKVSART